MSSTVMLSYFEHKIRMGGNPNHDDGYDADDDDDCNVDGLRHVSGFW